MQPLQWFGSWLLTPTAWFVLTQFCALWCLGTGRWKTGRTIFALSIASFLIVFYSPLGGVVIRPLEQAYNGRALPQRIDGIIVLGGAEAEALTRAYGQPTFGEDSERLSEVLALAKRNPHARLVFTGRAGEAYVFAQFLASQGHDPATATSETASSNTYESAVHTYRLLAPRTGEVWVLITSAYHMPRAHGAFRKAGWDIVPYPVAYRALPGRGRGDANAVTFEVAVHEWLGIASYKLRGRM
jgi:uncharacterized SAM-binding protein YcdF (DUF218 family)